MAGDFVKPKSMAVDNDAVAKQLAPKVGKDAPDPGLSVPVLIGPLEPEDVVGITLTKVVR